MFLALIHPVTDISDVEKRLQKLPIKEDNNSSDSESIQNGDLSESSSVLQPWGKNRNVLPSCMSKLLQNCTCSDDTLQLTQSDWHDSFHEPKHSTYFPNFGP